MAQNKWLVVVIVLAIVAVIVAAWQLLRPKEQPIIHFTPEQAKQAEQERQKWEGGGGSPLPLPPKGGRR